MGGIAVATGGWPIAASGQRPGIPTVGFLNSGTAEAFEDRVAKFRQGLTETGYVEGQNVTVDYRFAEGRYERLPALAADLVRRGVKILVATGGDVAASAAAQATSRIPIVFVVGSDPVGTGLVTSLNRPGGHITGVSIYTASLAAKRLELARELVADPRFVAVLTNPASPTLRAELANVETAARERGQRILVLNSSVDEDLETSFAEMVSQQAGVLLLLQDGFFNSRRERIIRLAARHRVPAVYYERVFARAGGLLSYGASIAEGYRHAGRYSGLILKGASPADLPVLQPTKFELVINLETARAIGLQIQPSLLVRADEVIE